MILGQDKFLEFVDKSNLSSFPQTLLLLGERGSGKHLLTKYVTEKLNLPLEEISTKLSLDYLIDINTRITPTIYLIDITKITEKQQSSLLKFTEEPLKNSYIIILAENSSQVLDTIKNRCYIYNLQTYSKNVLKQFLQGSSNEVILEIAHTPGQVIMLEGINLESGIKLANLILDKLQVASLPNTLTISNKIAFNGEKDKFPLELFLNVMFYTMKLRSIQGLGYPTEILMCTRDLQEKLIYPNMNKKQLFDNYLLTMWEAVRKNANLGT